MTRTELAILIAVSVSCTTGAYAGVDRYLAHARAGDAKRKVSAITRAAVGGFERLMMDEHVIEASPSINEEHRLCGSAQPVPATKTAPGDEYIVSNAEDVDFNTGDHANGWRCLRYRDTEALHHQYDYWADYDDFKASAHAFDAHALLPLTIARAGHVDAKSGAIVADSELVIEEP